MLGLVLHYCVTGHPLTRLVSWLSPVGEVSYTERCQVHWSLATQDPRLQGYRGPLGGLAGLVGGIVQKLSCLVDEGLATSTPHL